MEDIQLSGNGRIDAIIRDVAKDNDALLLTADYVQALVGKVEGVKVEAHSRSGEDNRTSLRESIRRSDYESSPERGNETFAKRGHPGNFEYVPIRDEEISVRDLEDIAKEITEAARKPPRGSVEISRSGATVIQLGHTGLQLPDRRFPTDWK